MKSLEVKKDIYWVGALDPDLRIFDIVMYTPFGTTYNSYVVKGSEKTALIETVKEKTFDQYIERLNSLNIDITKIDYIVVDHTEPDHAGSIAKLLDISKNAKVVGSQAAIKFLKAIVNRDFEYIIVGDGDSLSLGNKTLRFINAPFLHWPDSIYTYLEEDNMLFTCDSFGSHYCNGEVFNDLNANDEDYMTALKYYYDCIMGPFKSYMLKAIDKIKDLTIDIICPGHGPILRENPWKIVDLYKKWSTTDAASDKEKNVAICYVSAYGYTGELAAKIAEGIKSHSSDINITSFDITYSDINEVMAKLDKADGVLFGSPTINGDALKPILDILTTLNPIVHGGKVAGAFGSYGWSGEAVPNIEGRLKELRFNLLTPGLKINFKPSEEELTKAFNFGESFAEKIEEKLNKGVKTCKGTKNKKWKCIVCGLVIESPEVPKDCPACGAGSDAFIEIKEEEITFKTNKKEKYVIIGNGAAGYYAAEAIFQRNEACDIEIISGEKHLTYYRPQLSNYLSDSLQASSFYLSLEEWYKDKNIQLTLGTFVKDINSSEKKLLLDNGAEIFYDKLILATGAKNFMPDLQGINKSGVFTLRDFNDAKAIKDKIATSKEAVVVGGGLLGLEAAWEMKNLGLKVTVVEYFNRLLPKQLDDEGAVLFKEFADNSGINFILGEQAEEILGDENVSGIKLKSGKTLNTDLVLFSIGIRPNKELAEKAGIKTNKGIIVNEKMETSIKDIYACGDAAEFNGIVYGNWPAATEMGKAAGANAAGDTIKFEDFIPATAFNAFNLQLFSTGEVTSNANQLIELSYKKPENNIYRKLFFKENKLVGGILIGDTKKAIKLTAAVQERKSIFDMNKENILL